MLIGDTHEAAAISERMEGMSAWKGAVFLEEIVVARRSRRIVLGFKGR
jgi:hypothetical protein